MQSYFSIKKCVLITFNGRFIANGIAVQNSYFSILVIHLQYFHAFYPLFIIISCLFFLLLIVASYLKHFWKVHLWQLPCAHQYDANGSEAAISRADS